MPHPERSRSAQHGSQAIKGFRHIQGIFAESHHGPRFNGRLLMFRVVRDEHHRRPGQLRVGLDGLEDFDPVGIVGVQFAIDQHQIKPLFPERHQGIVHLMRLNDAGSEILFEQPPDGGVIGNALADVEDVFGHGAG